MTRHSRRYRISPPPSALPGLIGDDVVNDNPWLAGMIRPGLAVSSPNAVSRESDAVAIDGEKHRLTGLIQPRARVSRRFLRLIRPTGLRRGHPELFNRNRVESFGPEFVSNHLPHFVIQAEHLNGSAPNGRQGADRDPGGDKRADHG